MSRCPLKRFFLDRANLSVLLFSLKSLSIIFKFKPNIVIPLNGFWQLLLLKLFQPVLQYKIIIIGHSGPGWDERFNLYLKPNLFIAVTHPALSWAQKTCSWTKSILIPYAIDPKPYQQAKSIKPLLPKPIIFCPAALVPYKRIDLSIKAIAQLKNTSLLVSGRGELKQKLSKMGKKFLGKRFSLTAVPHQQMPQLYQQADVITLPSSPQENSPVVFLESLASGKIIVTTDSSRHRWLLARSGVFTNPEDLNQYQKSLKQALRLSQLSSTKNEIKVDLKKFSWSKVLSLYESALNSLINEI